MTIQIHPNIVEVVNKYFKDENFTIKLSPSSVQKIFLSLDELERYINTEVTFWREVDTEVQSKYESILSSFHQLTHSSKPNTVSVILNSAKESFSINAEGDGPISSETREAIFLKDLRAKLIKIKVQDSSERSNTYKCVKRFLLGGKNISPNNHNNSDFIALLDAYMAFYSSDILKQNRTNEEDSLGNLYKKFSIITQDGEKKTNELNAFREKSQEKFNSMLNTVENGAKNDFKVQQEEFKKIFNSNEQNWHDMIAVLEDLYEKKLQLSAPVTYWEEMVREKNVHGWIFAGLSIIVGFGSSIILFFILYDIHLLEIFSSKEFGINVIRASLLLLVITSILGYLLHILVKFTVSSFHLANDYKERRQLTYVYLAMLKGKDIDDNPQLKMLMIQSIFSRADTGLLKGEHSPTMPMSGIMEMMNKPGS